MFTQPFDYIDMLFLVSEARRRNRADIQDLYSRVERSGEQVQAVGYEIQRVSQEG